MAGATLTFPAGTTVPGAGGGLSLTSAGAPPAAAVARPTLALGARGPAVTALQERLRSRGAPVGADGRFGPATERAVRALQAAGGLKADGVVGPRTWRALDGGTPVVVPGTPAGTAAGGRPVLRLGALGPAVAELQRLLTQAGPRIVVDGQFGPGTQSAVLAFQRGRGLPADGIVGPASWSGLTSTPALPLALVVSTARQPSRTIGARARVVVAGDTLVSVAAATGTTGPALASANRIAPGSRLTVGGTLLVPGDWRCPVPGGGFIDDFGFPRAGHLHEGNDLFALRGTPVVAPVGGRVEQRTGAIGGNALNLSGDDGHRYYFAHLDRYAATGRVEAGTVIGYVGNTGNAVTTIPHLHFEIHPGGGAAVNPFPTITLACKR